MSNCPAAPRILIVDDELDVAELLVDVLAADGYAVEMCSDGNEALKKLREHSVELILCDLVMPGLDGAGLLRTLRSQHPDLADRVVFLTGDTVNEDARQFLEEARRPVIEKPFVPQDVRRTLRALLGDWKNLDISGT